MTGVYVLAVFLTILGLCFGFLEKQDQVAPERHDKVTNGQKGGE